MSLPLLLAPSAPQQRGSPKMGQQSPREWCPAAPSAPCPGRVRGAPAHPEPPGTGGQARPSSSSSCQAWPSSSGHLHVPRAGSSVPSGSLEPTATLGPQWSPPRAACGGRRAGAAATCSPAAGGGGCEKEPLGKAKTNPAGGAAAARPSLPERSLAAPGDAGALGRAGSGARMEERRAGASPTPQQRGLPRLLAPFGRVFKADLPQQPLPGSSGSASRGEPARSGSPGLAAPGRACPPPGFGVAVARASLPRPRARHVPATSLSQSERRGKRAGSGGTPIPRGQRPPEKGVSGRKGSAPSPRAARRRRRRLKPVLYGESNGRRHRRLPEEAGGRDGHREPGLAGGSRCPESGEGGTRGGEQPRPEPRGRGPGADNGNPIWCPISWARNSGGQRRAGQTDG